MNKREWMLQAALMWIRAGHGGTAGEAAETLSGVYDAICAASPETAQEGAWVEHDGDVSKAPPEGRTVEVETAGGDRDKNLSEVFDWDHVGDDAGNIVRWRYA